MLEGASVCVLLCAYAFMTGPGMGVNLVAPLSYATNGWMGVFQLGSEDDMRRLRADTASVVTMPTMSQVWLRLALMATLLPPSHLFFCLCLHNAQRPGVT